MSIARSTVKTSTRLALAALSAMLLAAALPSAASADYTKRELAGGLASAITSDGAGGHYVGGNFSGWNADNTGGGFLLDNVTYSGGSPTNTGALSRAYKMFDGGWSTVKAVLADGNGGWYVGGNFTRYGLTKTNTVAHINSDGTLDTAFQANVPLDNWNGGCNNGGVSTLALSGSTLYIGGYFSKVNGETRNNLAAVDATTGALKTFNANITYTADSNNCNNINMGVNALLVDGSSLYVGGNFAGINGETKAADLGKVDAVTGAADSTFNTAQYRGANLFPTCTSICRTSVTALAKVGSDLWVGSNYGTSRILTTSPYVTTNSYLIVVDPATKVLDTTKTQKAQAGPSGGGGYGGPSSMGVVRSIVQDGAGHVYVAGSFQSVGTGSDTLAREGIAEYDISAQKYMSAFNASLTATAGCANWNSGLFTTWGGASSQVEVSDLIISDNTLFATGQFTGVGGTARGGVAAIATGTGALDSDFSVPAVRTTWGCNGVTTSNGVGVPLAIDKTSDGKLFIGGWFDSYGGTEVGSLIHINADGTRDTSFGANVVPGTSSIYNYGGCYWWCTRGVQKLIKVGDKLYAGGDFTSVNGDASYKVIAVLNTSDGSLASQQVAGSFSAQSSGVSSSASMYSGLRVADMELDGTTLWLSGAFEYNDSSGRSINIVGIDTATGSKTSFTTYPWTGGGKSGSGTCYDYYGDPYPCGSTSTTYPAPPVNQVAIKNGKVYATSVDPKSNLGSSLTGNDGPRGSNLTGFGLIGLDSSTGNPVSGALGYGLVTVNCTTPGTGAIASCSTYQNSYAITFAGDRLFLGGQFNTINVPTSGGSIAPTSSARGGLAEIDPSTGAVLSFDAGISNTSSLCSGCSSSVVNILPDAGSIYVQGSFNTIGGQARGGIAQINLSDSSVTEFDPLDGTSFSAPTVYIDPITSQLYGSGIRYMPNDTDYKFVGISGEPTLKYSSPSFATTNFGYFVTVHLKPPSAPAITSPTASATSNSNTVAFSVVSGNTAECQIDGGAWTACNSPLSVSSLTDGSHTVAVRQTDSSGQISPESTVTWTVDRTAPTAPSVTMASPTLTNNATNSASAQFTFSVPSDASKVQCQIDGGAWADCTSPKSLSGLTDGSHTVKFRSVDAAGNTSSEQSFTWGVYTTAPAAPTITSPVAESTSSSNSVVFTQVTGLTYKCSNSATKSDPYDCTSPIDISSLSDGEKAITIWAIDPVGNESDPTTLQWVRDTTAPASPSVSGTPANGTSATTASFTLSGAGDGETYQCQVNGGAWADCTSPFEISGLVDGPQSVNVRLVDAAGNVSDATEASWFIGTPVSKPTVTSPAANGPSNSSTVEFTTDSNTTTTCSIDGAPPVACTSPLDISGLGEGDHTVVIKATDGDGNTNETTFSWTVDVTAPDSPGVTGAPADGTTATTASLTLTGASAGDVYECSVNGGAFATCTSPLELTGLTDGVQTIKVRLKDAAGNTSAETQVLWRIGDEAPTPPLGQTGSAVLSGPGSVVVGTLAKRVFNGPNFNINTIWPAGAKRVIVSNSPAFLRAQSFPVASTAAWNQPLAKPGTFGSRTVYFKYTGDGIDTTKVYTVTFNWDRAAPYLTMFAKKHALGYAPDAWKVRFKGGDKGLAGLAKVQIWNKKNGMPQKPPVAGATNIGFVAGFKDVVTVPGRYAPQWARVSDKAGNWSRWYMVK